VAAGRGIQSLSTQMPADAIGGTDGSVFFSTAFSRTIVGTSTATAFVLPSPHPASTAIASTGTEAPPLSWTLNSEPDLAGYKVYVGTAAGLYTYSGSPFVVGPTGSYRSRTYL
jgi:hypothetical protein